MVYVAKRMQDRPNNVQTAVEMTYDLTFNQITRANMQADLARKWFPFIAAIFFFILISNLIGYIPLPTNTEHPIHIGSLEIPSFAIYAATANVSVPLVLTLVVWFSYHIEGIRAKGFIGLLQGLAAGGHRRWAGDPRLPHRGASRSSSGSSPCRCDCSPTCSPDTC